MIDIKNKMQNGEELTAKENILVVQTLENSIGKNTPEFKAIIAKMKKAEDLTSRENILVVKYLGTLEEEDSEDDTEDTYDEEDEDTSEEDDEDNSEDSDEEEVEEKEEITDEDRKKFGLPPQKKSGWGFWKILGTILLVLGLLLVIFSPATIGLTMMPWVKQDVSELTLTERTDMCVNKINKVCDTLPMGERFNNCCNFEMDNNLNICSQDTREVMCNTTFRLPEVKTNFTSSVSTNSVDNDMIYQSPSGVCPLGTKTYCSP